MARTKNPMTRRRAPVVNSNAPNTPMRDMRHAMGGLFASNTKHNYYRDFGWPEQLSFTHFYRMYLRNSIASAVVDRTIDKVWQEDPEIWESHEPAASKAEADIADRFADIRVWRQLADVDRRAMVGRYAAAILRLADGQPFDQPVQRVPGGLMGLVDIIPAWESQLYPVNWDENVLSINYGKPTMFQFSEASIADTNNAAPRSFAVHPDRVIIWSADGTVHGHSELESIYNDLIDCEKIKGAGGEGFWKSSRGSISLEAPEGVSPDQLALSMGVDISGLRREINDQIDDWQSGFDKGLMLGGLKAQTLSISLPSPEHFFAGPIQSISAARRIPMRELMGSMSGQRASDEDARQWALTCMARRVNRCKPLILEFINRLERWGIIAHRDWFVGWADLTESTAEGKMERAFKMAEINAKTTAGDVAPFTPAEIREAAGYDPDELPDDVVEDEAIDDASTGLGPGDNEDEDI